MSDVNISTCWCCKDRIYFRGRQWRHKADWLPYSSIGGDHMASPVEPVARDEDTASRSSP